MKKKKRSSKNLKINTRIVLTAILAIIIPVIIIASFSTVFIQTISSYFNFSSVTTNTYSIVNQIQWNQTLSSITNELTDDDKYEQKLNNIKSFVTPLEKLNSYIYIEENGKVFYATESEEDIIDMVTDLVPAGKEENVNYFGNNGLAIVNHANNKNDSYLVIIVNHDYTVNDATFRMGVNEYRNILLGRTGIIVLIIVLLFIISISIISLITSKTIVTPIKKIAEGADEIARGNLDYNIDYDSTNELGQTVNSFNGMRARLKESLELQNRAETERKILVAGIAHDLRTPLTSAKGYAEGILDGVADTPQKKERYIKTIIQSIDNTEKILDDLLAYSRLDLNTYELNLEKINVAEFFNDGADEIRLTLEKEDIAFNYSFNCSNDAVISVDTDRFVRVINNIISNSIKYTGNKADKKVDLSVNEYEKTVIIEISDNGIGVDKESLPKIFDAMYRADKARSSVAEGSGLGLSICKQIIELHGGSIWARSEIGEGLSIFISIPKIEVK